MWFPKTKHLEPISCCRDLHFLRSSSTSDGYLRTKGSAAPILFCTAAQGAPASSKPAFANTVFGAPSQWHEVDFDNARQLTQSCVPARTKTAIKKIAARDTIAPQVATIVFAARANRATWTGQICPATAHSENSSNASPTKGRVG